MLENRLIGPKPQKDDTADRAIRPSSLDEYIGQPKVREQMKVLFLPPEQEGRR